MNHDVIVPMGAHMVNTLIVTQNARALIEFLKQVFDAKEDRNALAYSESDGKVFNSDVCIGDTHLNIFDRKEGWKHTPSLLQVYVKDIDEKIDRALRLGADLITKPTDFYGGKLARFIDPQGNLWWLFELFRYEQADWETPEGYVDEDTTWKADEDPDMAYIHDSLVEGMKKLDQFL